MTLAELRDTIEELNGRLEAHVLVGDEIREIAGIETDGTIILKPRLEDLL